jgi:hypothetical protein
MQCLLGKCSNVEITAMKLKKTRTNAMVLTAVAFMKTEEQVVKYI